MSILVFVCVCVCVNTRACMCAGSEDEKTMKKIFNVYNAMKSLGCYEENGSRVRCRMKCICGPVQRTQPV